MSKYKELIKIVAENPDLRVIPLVHQDCVNEDYCYTVANFNNVRVEEYCYYDDGVFFKSDLSELIEKVWEDIEDPDATEEDAEEIVNGFIFEKAIFVDIEA